MHDGLKIFIGVGATALLALGLHGPMRQGEAFALMQQARLPAAAPVKPLAPGYPNDPYSGEGKIHTLAEGAEWGAADTSATTNGTEARTVTPKPEAASSKPAQPAAPKPVASPAPKPLPQPASLAANACQRRIDTALAGRVMSFRPGSAWLNPQSNRMIADVATALKGCHDVAILIGGHTDGKGDDSINRVMSQERADRVRAALVAKGVATAVVSARGYGSAQPLRAGNRLDPANRRISFTVTKGGA